VRASLGELQLVLVVTVCRHAARTAANVERTLNWRATVCLQLEVTQSLIGLTAQHLHVDVRSCPARQSRHMTCTDLLSLSCVNVILGLGTGQSMTACILVAYTEIGHIGIGHILIILFIPSPDAV